MDEDLQISYVDTKTISQMEMDFDDKDTYHLNYSRTISHDEARSAVNNQDDKKTLVE
jgi:hypothetical protein